MTPTVTVRLAREGGSPATVAMSPLFPGLGQAPRRDRITSAFGGEITTFSLPVQRSLDGGSSTVTAAGHACA